MTTFTIDTDNNITAHGTPEEATAAPFDSFASQKELAELAAGWPAERLVAIWNSLPGVTPVKKFKDRTTAATRIWKSIQDLGEAVTSKAALPAKPKAERKAKGGAQVAEGALTKGKATIKATAAKTQRSQLTARGQQDGPGGGHAPAQERSHLGRDHGKNG